ncbi:hypothetical protein CYLTODRAFT_495231 [Cylindrobasidium torrendii FP15055 ss-10]|uniref:Uncharacterized protein n=1 Tax=Cylindrobasidium torrendii FP15055 ss-10 TaxID=1314674 RepID=A0A0D7AUH0_9AGAR|nr:hypothetical protein CYLTODRAFT_495231 [Cylindrobasidium torrendii FP15055 ss-10]
MLAYSQARHRLPRLPVDCLSERAYLGPRSLSRPTTAPSFVKAIGTTGVLTRGIRATCSPPRTCGPKTPGCTYEGYRNLPVSQRRKPTIVRDEEMFASPEGWELCLVDRPVESGAAPTVSEAASGEGGRVGVRAASNWTVRNGYSTQR